MQTGTKIDVQKDNQTQRYTDKNYLYNTNIDKNNLDKNNIKTKNSDINNIDRHKD